MNLTLEQVADLNSIIAIMTRSFMTEDQRSLLKVNASPIWGEFANLGTKVTVLNHPVPGGKIARSVRVEFLAGQSIDLNMGILGPAPKSPEHEGPSGPDGPTSGGGFVEQRYAMAA